ncbi:MAG: efflux RND transporter permease subunit [Planctomycetes bacterium]|nr:efflux RND transporter permease subunit [Planctomycetota bacterium]
MLSRLIDLALRHRLVVLAGTALLALAGGLALRALPLDAFPDVSDVQVQINTVAEVLSPEEIERQITVPVELALGGLSRVKQIRSLSRFGLSQVVVTFQDGLPIQEARAQVLERLQAVELPAGIERPRMGPIATGLGEIFHYIVTASGGDLTEARTLHDWVVRPQMLAVRGISEVNAWGGFEGQFHVVVRPERLAQYGTTLDEVAGALDRANANVGGGSIDQGGEQHLLQGISRPSSIEEIRQIAVRPGHGTSVRVGDVAEVVEGHEIRRGVVTAGGSGEVVLGLAFLQMGENSAEVTRHLRARMEEVRKSLPAGARVSVVYDRRVLVDEVLATVRTNLFEGALLVISILYLFLGGVRPALIVAAAIPLSMLFTFNAMLRFGIAGSLMSLGAIDFGLIVDSSVVMVENVVRHLAASGNRPMREVVRDAAIEVRRPTLFGELIVMIVYLPILTLEGVEGKLFRPMALTVILALVVSMVLSMTLMPVLASLGMSRKANHREPFLARLAKWMYAPVLRWAVAHQRFVLGFAVCFLALGALLASRLGAVFVPKLDEGSIVINTVRLAGVSLDESARYGMRIESLLRSEFPDEVKTVWSRTGTAEVATDPMGIELTDLFIMLRDRALWKRARTKEELIERMDEALAVMPGMRYAFSQPIEMRMNEMVSGVRLDVGVKLFGPDFEVLKGTAERIEEVLNSVPGSADVSVEQVTGQPVLEVRLDHGKIARYGLTAGEVLDAVGAVAGRQVGEVHQGQRRFPLVVRLPDEYRQDPDRIAMLPIVSAHGERVLLGQVARVSSTTGPTAVNREWGERRILVQANVRGRDLAGFVSEARSRLEVEVLPSLPPGYHIEWGGQYEHLIRGSQRLAIVVPLALLLIFGLLYATYGNVLDAVRVFSGIPFAAVGGVLALWIRDMPFSISAGVGFVALCGVAVLDDMILVSYVRQLLAGGLALEKALEEAAMTRLRPVLMTGLVSSLGFLPMAFSTGIGAEVQRPLATVVVGGVVSSTVMSLLVLRVVYLFVGRLAGRDRAR